MSVFTDIETSFEAEAFKVEAKIKEFASAFLPEVANALEVGLEDIAAIAFGAVLNEAKSLASGNEKFGNAVTNVVQTVESQGKTVLLQTAQTGVQLAFLTAQKIATQT